jgi:Ubiquitin family
VTPADNPPPYSKEIKEIILKNVFFKHLDGRTLTVNDIPISWTIRQLRKKLLDKHAMNLDEYRFIWGGKQLNDGL